MTDPGAIERDEHRGDLTGHQGAEDQNIRVRHVFAKQPALRFEPLGRQRPGVSALADGFVSRNVKADDLGLQAAGLLTRLRADVDHLDHASQTPGGGDRLQSDDAGAENQKPRR